MQTKAKDDSRKIPLIQDKEEPIYVTDLRIANSKTAVLGILKTNLSDGVNSDGVKQTMFSRSHSGENSFDLQSRQAN